MAARCQSTPELLVAITAHICNTNNALLLNSTLRSAWQYAPDADVIVFDSLSPWPVASLPLELPSSHSAPSLRIHRMPADHGQLGVLRILDSLKPTSKGLVFLQHTMQLAGCAARIARHGARQQCVAAVLRTNVMNSTRRRQAVSMERPFWRRHQEAQLILAALGAPHNIGPPWTFEVAEHSAIYLSPEAWRRASELGLWASQSTPELPAIRALIDNGALAKAPIVAVNQAVEAVTGFLVAWSNRVLLPPVSRSGKRAADVRRQRYQCSSQRDWTLPISKVHGKSFQARGCERFAAMSRVRKPDEWRRLQVPSALSAT